MSVVGPSLPVAPLYLSGLPFLFGAAAWLLAREHGTPGGWPAFLWGLLLGPIGLAAVALIFRQRSPTG